MALEMTQVGFSQIRLLSQNSVKTTTVPLGPTVLVSLGIFPSMTVESMSFYEMFGRYQVSNDSLFSKLHMIENEISHYYYITTSL